MRIFFIHSLSCLIVTSSFGMQLVKKPFHFKKNFIRTAIAKSAELDAMRKTWRINNSPQDIVDISQGKIVIKEEILLGKRYGTCHNYAFTKLMGIIGKTPKVLNIRGQKDYYGDHYLKTYDFFDLLAPGASLQAGDLAVYILEDENGLVEDVTHTGIVVGDDCIESKWGPIPAVFEHPIWYVPANFGDCCLYLRSKMNGSDLLASIQKRLQQKRVKKRYDVLALAAQKALCNAIERYEQNKFDENFDEICTLLEYHMNVYLDVPDENGVTPLVHAEKIGCEKLKKLFAAYQKYNE